MKKSEYSLGLASVSFRDRTPLEIIKAVFSAGLSFIEWGSDIHAPCEDIKRMINAELSEEMYVTDAYIPSTKFSDIAFCEYA